MFSVCGGDKEEVTDTSVNETAIEQTVDTIEKTVLTGQNGHIASSEDISRLMEENELPVISISENMSFDDVMLAGQNAGEYYGSAAKGFFGFGVEFNRKINDDRLRIRRGAFRPVCTNRIMILGDGYENYIHFGK